MATSVLPAQEPSPAPFQATIAQVKGVELWLQDGRRLRLQGLSLPAASIRPPGFLQRLQDFWRAQGLLAGQKVWVYPEAGKLEGVDLVALVKLQPQAASLNAQALRRGLALFSCRTPQVREMAALLAAARQAREEGKGWFQTTGCRVFGAGEPLPYLNGAVLGLHELRPQRDYHPHLDELAAMGFRHISFLFTVFVATVDGVQINRRHKRTVQDARLLETIAYAKKKGMSVMLLPILLIEDCNDTDWRGTLRPKDEDRFWLNYDAFLSHYLDIAQHGGVEIFSIGSEFGSLENRSETWQRLIQNARGRFTGLLTYSVNWDHLHGPKFLQDLDLIGMTAYFSLTNKKDPSRVELTDAWRRQGKALRAALAGIHKPVFFTELGYASQDGINTDPWDYTMNKEGIDLPEQADCFAAFMAVAGELDFLQGAYFFDYFDTGGSQDWSYSPRGKPAMELWQQWARQGAILAK